MVWKSFDKTICGKNKNTPKYYIWLVLQQCIWGFIFLPVQASIRCMLVLKIGSTQSLKKDWTIQWTELTSQNLQKQSRKKRTNFQFHYHWFHLFNDWKLKRSMTSWSMIGNWVVITFWIIFHLHFLNHQVIILFQDVYTITLGLNSNIIIKHANEVRLMLKQFLSQIPKLEHLWDELPNYMMEVLMKFILHHPEIHFVTKYAPCYFQLI